MGQPNYESLKARWNELLAQFPEKEMRERLSEEEFSVKQSFLLRTRRAISWLGRAEEEKEEDARFIFLWVSFNALYGQLPVPKSEKGAESDMFNDYFRVLAGLGEDAIERICGIFENGQGESKNLLRNKYIFKEFWDFQHYEESTSKECMAKLKCQEKQFQENKRQKEVSPMLETVFSRIYVMRNQMMHGSTAKDSPRAGSQRRDCTRFMEIAVPVFIDMMLDKPDEDWGRVYYPRLSGREMEPL